MTSTQRKHTLNLNDYADYAEPGNGPRMAQLTAYGSNGTWGVVFVREDMLDIVYVPSDHLTKITIINRTGRDTHETCARYDCGLPAWIDTSRAFVVRMDTPYCERHSREWSDSRATDLESSMGN
jgi:hypothetical protein